MNLKYNTLSEKKKNRVKGCIPYNSFTYSEESKSQGQKTDQLSGVKERGRV